MWAVHHKVDNLVAFTDWNGQQIDGPTRTITGLEELNEKWAAFGWDVIVADGHDYQSILDAFKLARTYGKLKGGPDKKVIVSFVMIFFLVWDLGYIMIPELKAVFDNLGIIGYIVYLIYIYCGWSFFD